MAHNAWRAAVAACIVLGTPWAARGDERLYVDDSASGANNGATWASAYTDLQAALDSAAKLVSQGRGPVDIWVAAGEYKPRGLPGSDKRLWRFELLPQVRLYGGFAANETRRDDRNPALFDQTILNGDHGEGVHSYHVLVAEASDAVTTLDGFKITGGRALSGPTLGHNRGGGLLMQDVSFDIRNCLFEGNEALEGGAVSIAGSRMGGSGTFRHCRFVTNKAVTGQGASGNGGAIRMFGARPRFVSCLFFGNESLLAGGAAYAIADGTTTSQPVFVNCAFTGNIATTTGGAMRLDECITTMVNCVFNANTSRNLSGGALHLSSTGRRTDIDLCTFAGNNSTSRNGDAILNAGSNLIRLRNSIIYHNGGPAEPNEILHMGTASMTPRSSCFRGAPTSNGNTGLDPGFIALPNDLRLSTSMPRSPCIDAGDNSLVPLDEHDADHDGNTTEQLPVDHTGLLRIVRENQSPPVPTVNMGAYEAMLEEVKWNDPLGGDFADPANWMPQSPPTGRSIATFDLGSTYETKFTRHEESYYLRVGRGSVELDLDAFNYHILGRDTSISVFGTNQAQVRLDVEGSRTVPNTLYARTARIDNPLFGDTQLRVRGSATTLALGEGAEVGHSGHGRLVVSNSARTISPGLDLGVASGSTGTLQVSGRGSELVYGGREPTGPGERVFRWADAGDATIEVFAEGLLLCEESYALRLAEQPRSFARATVREGSTWHHKGEEFIVGEGGRAVVLIEDGGLLVTESGNGAVLGRLAGARGEVFLSGAGSGWRETSGRIRVGGLGAATLRVRRGSIVEALEGMTVGSQGLLQGDGEVIGDVLNSGLVAPGTSLATGLLTIDGAFTQVDQQQSGRLRIRLNGLTRGSQHDALDVTGLAELNGGLFVEILDSLTPFEPQLGNVFQVLGAERLDNSRFDVAYLPGLPGGLFFTVHYDEVAATVSLAVQSLQSPPAFGEQETTTLPGIAPVSAVLADLDGKLGPDLAILYADPQTDEGVVLTLFNQGSKKGEWLGFIEGRAYPSGGTDPRDLVVGNIDGDAGLDLVAANAGNDTVTILTNDGVGGFKVGHTQTADIDHPVALALANFTNDAPGPADIIVANRRSGQEGTLLENTSSMGAIRIKPDPIPTGPRPSSVDPVRGGSKNSTLNLIAFTNAEENTVTIVDARGAINPITIPVGDAPLDVATANLNGDDFGDIVTANAGDGSVSIILGVGEGVFAPPVTLGVGNGVLPLDPELPRERRLVVANLDSDDDPDIAVLVGGPGGRRIGVLRNDFDGSQLAFTRQENIPVAGVPVALLADDVDDDQTADLIAVGTEGGEGPTLGQIGVNLNGACYADCDLSTGRGVLDVFDMLCFQNHYDAGDPYACDCDTTTGPGNCDIFDFLCFQNAYNAGCP